MDPQFETEIPSSSHESLSENEFEPTENGLNTQPCLKNLNLDGNSERFSPCEVNDKSIEGIVKTPPKKVETPVERAKALIQEFELQRKEQLETNVEKNRKHSRSKSKSPEKDLTFLKRDRKVRNYRNRKDSPELESHVKKVKIKNRNPKNWDEFVRDKCSFHEGGTRQSHDNHNDFTRQLLFETPSKPIRPWYFKAENGERINVPYSFVRKTTTRPVIAYSANLRTCGEIHMKRSEVLNKTSKNFKTILERFLSKSPVKKFKQTVPNGQRNWYQKIWKEDSKLLETSMGLSFLQSYSDGDEEEHENNEQKLKKTKSEETSWTPERKTSQTPSTSPKKTIPEPAWQIELLEKSKIEKKMKRSETESNSSSDEKPHKKRKKYDKEIDKKKKTEKLKKLKKKRKKEKERKIEREILKKLKKEIELNLVKVETEVNNDGIKTPEVAPPAPEESNCATTPDTDEYHSNWESEEETVSNQESQVKTCEKRETISLEMPLNIRCFTRREPAEIIRPDIVNVDAEIKRLEEERVKLSNERMRLELEKIKLKELELIQTQEITCNLEGAIFRKKLAKKNTRWDPDEAKTMTKIDPNAFTISNSPEISSTKSPNVLEDAYEEFMKAVSNNEDACLPTSTNEHKFNLVTLPSPKTPVKPLVDPQEFSLNLPVAHKIEDVNESPQKPILFSSLVIPSKKSSVLEKTNWKVDEDSEEETPTPEQQINETSQVVESPQKRKTRSPSVDSSKRKKDNVETKKKDEGPRRKRVDIERRRRRASVSPRRRRNYRRRSPLLLRRYETQRRRTPPRKRRSSTPIKLNNTKRTPSPKSPLDELKKSVADSTISDDSLLLPQIYGENSSSPQPSKRTRNPLTLSPKRPSLDERINQVLGIESQPPPQQPISWNPTVGMEPQMVYQNYQNEYYHENYQELEQNSRVAQNKVLQVGNILQVVPNEDVSVPPTTAPVQRIVQVGNMLQIVPSDLVPPPPPPPVLQETQQQELLEVPEKIMSAKQAEKAQRKIEKLERKKERERRRKEREKKIKQKLKITTEEMIKRALELDGFIEDEAGVAENVPEIISETPGIDSSKSILRYRDDVKTERKKSVQFADGVRPGDGTSPSGGEELSSPPPPQTDNLPKTKRLKKLEKLRKKKRKVKVKKLKLRTLSSESDEDEFDNLPPPSPPPGSPPLHVFPQRVKVHTINNIPQHYLQAYGVTTAPQTQMAPPFQIPPTSVFRTQTTHVIGQNFNNRTVSGVPRGDQSYTF